MVYKQGVLLDGSVGYETMARDLVARDAEGGQGSNGEAGGGGHVLLAMGLNSVVRFKVVA